jgi:hypothetical protein
MQLTLHGTMYVSYNMQEASEKKEYETRPGNLKQKQQERPKGPVMFQAYLDSVKCAIIFHAL